MKQSIKCYWAIRTYTQGDVLKKQYVKTYINYSVSVNVTNAPVK